MDEMTKFRSLLDQHGIQWRGFTGSIASRPVERTYFQIGGYIWSVIYATHRCGIKQLEVYTSKFGTQMMSADELIKAVLADD